MVVGILDEAGCDVGDRGAAAAVVGAEGGASVGVDDSSGGGELDAGVAAERDDVHVG
jgi:hypothetical protein